MTYGGCEKQDCTVAETGTCLLHPNPSECPHFRSRNDQVNIQEAPGLVSPVKPTIKPTELATRRFHSAIELGTQDAAQIMRARYAYLVGILGSTNVGKTCFLTSLYLMASHGDLAPGYLFAGSLTLQGFDERARRLRKWQNNVLPDKLAEHTRLSDPRSPALLHLALRQTRVPCRHLDLLLTDLPGEWTKNLVDHAATARRFAFLHRADGIILVIDGPLLASLQNRHSELQRAKLLLKRLLVNVGIDRTIPLILLVSKCDELDMNAPDGIHQLSEDAKALGFTPEVVLAAAFSKKPTKVKSGTGVLEAIEKVVNKEPAQRQPQEAPPIPHGLRAFQRFPR